MDYLYYLFIVLFFVAVVLALEGMLLVWNNRHGPEAKRIEQRLRLIEQGGETGSTSSLLRQRVLSDTPAMQQLLQKVPHIDLLDKILQQAGSKTTVGSLLLAGLVLGLLGLLLALSLRLPFILALVIAAGCTLLPLLWLFSSRASRMAQFERQLPDTLDLIARALRAGHSFSSALGMVASESAEPTAGEFRLVFDEINFGISVQEALVGLTRRVPIGDLSYFVVAVLIQKETGGNLADLLGKLSHLIRERFMLLMKVKALSAEGRISAWILSLMPFVMAMLLSLINPKFMAILWNDPAGFRLTMVAIGLMVMGIFWMWRVIKIRV